MNNAPSLAHADMEARYALLASQLGPDFGRQYLRVQLSVDQNAKVGEAGYAPPDVVNAIKEIDNPKNIEPMVKVGRAFAELYRPLIADFVGRYLVK